MTKKQKIQEAVAVRELRKTEMLKAHAAALNAIRSKKNGEQAAVRFFQAQQDYEDARRDVRNLRAGADTRRTAR